jgi:hypothetical protein
MGARLMGLGFHITPAQLALFDRVWMPSRLAINRALWAMGLALQCALVVVVFRRRIARRFPCFTALICFYPLRAGLLFALASRVDADVYNPLFSALAFAEIFLQVAVAVELLWRVNRETDAREASAQETIVGRPKSARRGGLALLILLGVAGSLTWLVLKFTPARAPVDRVQVFLWFVMIAVFVAALKNARSANPVRIAAGFAAFSLIQLAASFGRAHAFLKHNAGWYLGWSYAPAVGYLAVVTFWLISLRKEQ